MCVECGTVLSVSSSPVAQQERDVHPRADRGRQGPRSRSRPRWSPSTARTCSPSPSAAASTLALWLVPIALVVLAAARHRVAAPALARARRRRPSETELPPPLSAEDARAPGRGARAVNERRRHDGLRRVRGRLRLLHLALRAAARARLPVRGLRRLDRRDAAASAAARRSCCRRSCSACPSRSSSSRSGMTATGLGSTLQTTAHAREDRRRW